MGYENARPMLRMEAVTAKFQADREAFLGGLDGAPQCVVCGNERDA